LVQASGNPLHLEPDQINQILVRVHSRIERVLPLPFACFNNGTMFTYRQLEMVTVIFHLDTAHIRRTLHLIYHVFFSGLWSRLKQQLWIAVLPSYLGLYL
jgi:hypothetical protein